jgi:hypothetical protein
MSSDGLKVAPLRSADKLDDNDGKRGSQISSQRREISREKNTLEKHEASASSLYPMKLNLSPRLSPTFSTSPSHDDSPFVLIAIILSSSSG